MLNQSLGNLRSHSIAGSALILHTDTARAIVTLYADSLVRIRIFQGDEQPDFSYAVVATPQQVQFSLEETDTNITLTTTSLRLTISKSPLRFTLYDSERRILCEDDAAFGTSWLGTEVTTYKKLQAGERFIGLGEKTGNLDRRGSAYTNWNTDKFAYPTDQDPLYMSVPFYMGIHSSRQYGIFFDNTYRSHFNMGASNNRFSSFGAEGGEMNYYLFAGTMREIISNYTWLTGRIKLPPMWSLGTQQCRYSYYPDSEVVNIAQTYRSKKIPADVIYLDIHYMDAYKVFTFHPERFPQPAKMVAQLKEMGFHTAVILDPGIKVEDGYKQYEEGTNSNYFVKYPDGENYSGEVWPGWSHFPDFTRADVRQWWADAVKFYTEKGIDALWNDMNEPAAWGQSLPDLIEFDYEGQRTTHRQARNIYGMQMARSTYEGARKQLDGKRPFILNRAGYSGVQRYAASWTGDNTAQSDNMLLGVRLINSMGLSGLAYAGYDVGGFADEASPDLFARWLVLGTFSPLFRFHSGINTKDAEPWAFGEEVEEIARHYIGLRYRLMPYIYSAFYESTQTGIPVSRSLTIDYTHDVAIYDTRFQNQYLFGHALLITPVAAGQDYIKVYLPTQTKLWYDLHTGAAIQAGEHIAEVRRERYPLYVRAGSIICMQSTIQSMSEQPTTTLEVHLYYGAENNSSLYYEDDGSTYQYEKGNFYRRNIQYQADKRQLIFAKSEGSYTSHFKKVKLYFHGFGAFDKVFVNNERGELSSEDYQFIVPVSSFDPYYHVAATDMLNKNVVVLEFRNDNDEIKVAW